MSKKKIIILSIVIVVILLMTASVALSSYIQHKNNEKIEAEIAEVEKAEKELEQNYPQVYKDAIAEGKPVMLFFYADWCTHCVNFMPIYNKLEKSYKGKYNFVKINIDVPEHRPIAEGFYITGIPAVFIIEPKTNETEEVKTFVNNYILLDINQLKQELDAHLKKNK